MEILKHVEKLLKRRQKRKNKLHDPIMIIIWKNNVNVNLCIFLLALKSEQLKTKNLLKKKGKYF